MAGRALGAVLSLSCVAALSGCGSDPAAQAPVRLRPGLYAVAMSGEAYTPFHRSTPSDLQKQVCVSPDEAEFFPQTFPRQYLSKIGYACEGQNTERTGNRISGKITCPLSDGATGKLALTFEGEVAEQEVDVRAKMNFEDLGPGAEELADNEEGREFLDKVRLRLRIQRTGDCPA